MTEANRMDEPNFIEIAGKLAIKARKLSNNDVDTTLSALTLCLVLLAKEVGIPIPDVIQAIGKADADIGDVEPLGSIIRITKREQT